MWTMQYRREEREKGSAWVAETGEGNILRRFTVMNIGGKNK